MIKPNAGACNGGRSWREWWECDKLLMGLAVLYLLTGVSSEAVTHPLLRVWVISAAPILLFRRWVHLTRYAAQMWAATVAISISAAYAIGAERYSIAFAWFLIATLQTIQLRD